MTSINDQNEESHFSEFSKEMQKVYDYVLWDLKTKNGDYKKANQITTESINKIKVYLRSNIDSKAANLLSSFYYQAGCDLLDSGNPLDALGFFMDSMIAQQLCFETSRNLNDLHELAFIHFFFELGNDNRFNNLRRVLGHG